MELVDVVFQIMLLYNFHFLGSREKESDKFIQSSFLAMMLLIWGRTGYECVKRWSGRTNNYSRAIVIVLTAACGIGTLVVLCHVRAGIYPCIFEENEVVQAPTAQQCSLSFTTTQTSRAFWEGVAVTLLRLLLNYVPRAQNQQTNQLPQPIEQQEDLSQFQLLQNEIEDIQKELIQHHPQIKEMLTEFTEGINKLVGEIQHEQKKQLQNHIWIQRELDLQKEKRRLRDEEMNRLRYELDTHGRIKIEEVHKRKEQKKLLRKTTNKYDCATGEDIGEVNEDNSN